MRPWVLIPVFNAPAALQRCLEALDETLSPGERVLLCDDASTDAAVAPLIERWQAGTALEVHVERSRQNRGFVGNVNAAMARLGGEDAILLNTDTVPAPGWFEAMVRCAEVDPRIATATPWSNNAEICSFPQLCIAAPIPGQRALKAIGRAAAQMVDVQPPELPTGVGFAMFVRGSAWTTLGGFDEATFGRGYGEENDFCRRAAGHGWRNVLCPTAYVAHEGHASFAGTGHSPGGENLRRLTARYPDYNERVATFICEDPLRPLRDRLAELLERESGIPS
ncbi:glycosyltransferase family 2 protein [Pseudomarimonas salicorniae]|uniref:Glycosyltransferase family 2 protein n=1 Tax=Pseudomarimonas salicorniae TaxID=2933270 RepID=A0ABT0GJ69_9GAMM|nr:glycosyltransferase family 2 protein [Lysobacter sp. CAU 1642]MCK7594590.1 glycosyltransferase family 2 protein [Lysobacter sp. CAU 1642]